MTKIDNKISKKIIAAIVAALLVLTMVPNSLFNSISAWASEGETDSATGLQGFNDEEFQEWFNDFSEDYIDTPSSDGEYYNYGTIDEYLNAENGDKSFDTNKNDEPLSYEEIISKMDTTKKTLIENIHIEAKDIDDLVPILEEQMNIAQRNDIATFEALTSQIKEAPDDLTDAVISACKNYIENCGFDELNKKIRSGSYTSDSLIDEVNNVENNLNVISGQYHNYLNFFGTEAQFLASLEDEANNMRLSIDNALESLKKIINDGSTSLNQIYDDIDLSYEAGLIDEYKKAELNALLSKTIKEFETESDLLYYEIDLKTEGEYAKIVDEKYRERYRLIERVNERLKIEFKLDNVAEAISAWNLAKGMVEDLKANLAKLQELEIEIAGLEPLVVLATQDLSTLSDSIDALQLYVKTKQSEIDRKIDQLTLNLENQDKRTESLESTLHSLMIVVETMYTNVAFSISSEKFYEVKAQVLNYLNQLASECTNDKQDVLNTKDEISALLDDVWFTNIWLYGQNEELYVACNDKYDTIMQALEEARAIQKDAETFFTGSVSNSLTATNGMLNIVERSVREIEEAAVDVNKIKEKITDVRVDADIVLDPDNVLNKFEDLLGFTNTAIENVTVMEFHALPDNGGGTNPGGQGGGIRNGSGSGLAQTGDSMLALCVLCGLALIVSAGVLARQRKNQA